MILELLWKLLNCTVGKTTDIGHTADYNCNTNYSIIQLIMMLFISSKGKVVKTDYVLIPLE